MDKRIKELEDSVYSDPDNIDNYNRLANAYMRTGKDEEAFQALYQAVDRELNGSKYYLSLFFLQYSSGDLDHYEEAISNYHHNNLPEAGTLNHYIIRAINEIRAHFYPEWREEILQLKIGRWYGSWIWSESNNAEFRYINARCYDPIFSIAVTNWKEAREVLDWSKNYIKLLPKKIKLPPHIVKIDKEMKRLHRSQEEVLFFKNYQKPECESKSIVVSIEPEALFDFDKPYLNSPPVEEGRMGSFPGNARKVIEPNNEDNNNDYDDNGNYRNLSYDELPDFARLDLKHGEPYYVTAGVVTRQMMNYEDGRGYGNHTDPISKIYVGYIHNYLMSNIDGSYEDNYWDWEDSEYVKECENGHIEESLYVEFCQTCELDAIDAQEAEDGDIEPTRMYQVLRTPKKIVVDEDHPKTPKPPKHLNEAIAFLSRFFDFHNQGNMYLGSALSVFLEEGYYGIRDPEEV
jgi:hypothetical protein